MEHSTSVLIIARDLPPYNLSLGNVVRVLKLAEFLESCGHRVFLIAAKGVPISNFGYDALIDRLNINYVEDRYQKYVTRLHRRGIDAIDATPSEPRLSFGRRIKDIGLKSSTPDLGIFFLSGMYHAAIKLIKQENIKNVIVSSPPHSTQLVGLWLKRRLKGSINLITDYRDSWNCSLSFRKQNPMLQKVNEYMEAAVLKASDHLTYVSAPMLRKIDSKFKTRPESAHLIMNGFDQNMISRSTDVSSGATNSPLSIGHFGGLAVGKSQLRSMNTLASVIREYDLPIRIIQYGYCNAPSSLKTQLNGKIDIHGNLPHELALQSMRKMDALLFLHTQRADSDEVVSGKIFDYMLAERPILVVGPMEMEACKIIMTNKLGYCADMDDKQAIRGAILELLEARNRRQEIEYKAGDFLQYSRQTQYAKFLDIMV